MLEINVKNKAYDKHLIINNFDLDIKESEFISIIGPSGCGKSTLLKIIASLDKDYTGNVLYKNQKSIKNLAFIFQDSRLLPWLSVKENILLVSQNKDEKIIEHLLIQVGLQDYINAYIKELSGGMKKKVALIRAFINKPDVLLLDEAFVSLDYPSAKQLRVLFYDFFKEYSPIVIFVTHDLNEALCMSNRILFLSSKPSNIIYEYENIPSFDEKIFALKKEKILDNYPNILSGELY